MLVECRQGRRNLVIPEGSTPSRQLWPLLWLCMSLLSVLSVGCSPVERQPNNRLATEMGVPQAQQYLEEVLLRALNPPINAVEVTEEFVRVDVTNTTYQVRVFFNEVQRTEVFKNHLVILWGAKDRILFRPTFTNHQDAQAFADLMLSFRTAKRSAPAAPTAAKMLRHSFRLLRYGGSYSHEAAAALA